MNAKGYFIYSVWYKSTYIVKLSKPRKSQRSSEKHVCSLRWLRWNSFGLVLGPS